MLVMPKYKMAYAKAHLTQLVKSALAGQEIVIAKNDTPLVRLVPVGKAGSGKRTGGDLEGKVSLPDEFFAPLNDEDAAAWGL
jgi:prevent-host-death family protein